MAKSSQPDDNRTHGEKIRDTLISRHGADYYSKMGKVGGKKSNNRPFRDNPGAAKKAIEARWRKYREAKAAAQSAE